VLLSPGEEQLGLESDHLRMSVTKVKMSGAILSLLPSPPYAFMACTGTASLYHTGNLCLTVDVEQLELAVVELNGCF